MHKLNVNIARAGAAGVGEPSPAIVSAPGSGWGKLSTLANFMTLPGRKGTRVAAPEVRLATARLHANVARHSLVAGAPHPTRHIDAGATASSPRAIDELDEAEMASDSQARAYRRREKARCRAIVAHAQKIGIPVDAALHMALNSDAPRGKACLLLGMLLTADRPRVTFGALAAAAVHSAFEDAAQKNRR